MYPQVRWSIIHLSYFTNWNYFIYIMFVLALSFLLLFFFLSLQHFASLCSTFNLFDSVALILASKINFMEYLFFFLLKRNRSFRSKQSAIVTVLTYGPLWPTSSREQNSNKRTSLSVSLIFTLFHSLSCLPLCVISRLSTLL